MAFFGMKQSNTALSNMMKKLQAAGDTEPDTDGLEDSKPAETTAPVRPPVQPVILQSNLVLTHFEFNLKIFFHLFVFISFLFLFGYIEKADSKSTPLRPSGLSISAL